MIDEWPKTDNHRLFMNEMEELIEDEGELTRKEISNKLSKKLELSDDTLMMWLSKYREEIEGLGFSTRSKDDGSPGTPTVYWSVDN